MFLESPWKGRRGILTKIKKLVQFKQKADIPHAFYLYLVRSVLTTLSINAVVVEGCYLVPQNCKTLNQNLKSSSFQYISKLIANNLFDFVKLHIRDVAFKV